MVKITHNAKNLLNLDMVVYDCPLIDFEFREQFTHDNIKAGSYTPTLNQVLDLLQDKPFRVPTSEEAFYHMMSRLETIASSRKNILKQATSTYAIYTMQDGVINVRLCSPDNYMQKEISGMVLSKKDIYSLNYLTKKALERLLETSADIHSFDVDYHDEISDAIKLDNEGLFEYETTNFTGTDNEVKLLRGLFGKENFYRYGLQLLKDNSIEKLRFKLLNKKNLDTLFSKYGEKFEQAVAFISPVSLCMDPKEGNLDIYLKGSSDENPYLPDTYVFPVFSGYSQSGTLKAEDIGLFSI